MYDDKPVFRTRDLNQTIEDIEKAGKKYGSNVEKVFVADGDALIMDLDHWLPILQACQNAFPKLRRVSCYAMASNILEKTDAELLQLQQAGLKQLYIGPESGDDITLKRIAKGSSANDHIEASKKAQKAGIKRSVIFLLGAGGTKRSQQHAQASGELASAMDPEFLAALTLTIVPNTPIHRLEQRGKFSLPDTMGLLKELYQFINIANPTKALFRTNHASNYLPIGGYLPNDKHQMLSLINLALQGQIPLRDEWMRGL